MRHVTHAAELQSEDNITRDPDFNCSSHALAAESEATFSSQLAAPVEEGLPLSGTFADISPPRKPAHSTGLAQEMFNLKTTGLSQSVIKITQMPSHDPAGHFMCLRHGIFPNRVQLVQFHPFFES